MPNPKTPMFVRTKLFMFMCKHAWKSGMNKDVNSELHRVHKVLSDLAMECLKALDEDKGDQMLAKLEVLRLLHGDDNELEAMLNGTHPDVPDWLRK